MKHLDEKVVKTYRLMVEKAYPDELDNWPVISGYNLKFGKYRGWNILLFEHTGNPIPLRIPLEHLTQSIVGVDNISNDTDLARKKLARYFRVSAKDMLIILNPRASNLEQELDLAFKRHETAFIRKTDDISKIEIKKDPLVPAAIKPEKTEAPVKTVESIKDEINVQATKSVLKTVLHRPAKKEEGLQAEKQAPNVTFLRQPYKTQANKNKVFIINGSNEKNKKSMCNFLLSLGIQAMDWAEAVNLTGKTNPDSIEVIKTAFTHCQAAIILITYDMSYPGEKSELVFLPQADLNALYIAGLATGININTIIVVMGNSYPFLKMPNMRLTFIDNSLEKRKVLLDLIKLAGCDIKTRGKAWHISGDFDVELKPLTGLLNQPAPPGQVSPYQQKEEKPAEKQPTAPEPEKATRPDEETSRGKSFIDSLPLINILKTKKQPKESAAGHYQSPPLQRLDRSETEPKVIKPKAPVEKKPPREKQEPLPVINQEVKTPLKKNEIFSKPEPLPEIKEPQKPLEEPTVPKAGGRIYEETEYLNRIKELEQKLEALKNRTGRANQRAMDDIEKQIQAEKYRLRTIRQLANIENLKRNYDDFNKNNEDK